MGFRICYLATAAEPKVVAEYFGFAVSGTEEEMPDTTSWVARLTEAPRTILWVENPRFTSKNENKIAAFSEQHDIIACEVDETSMWCSATMWAAGQPKWSISHAGDGEDIFDLTVNGTPPAQFNEIRTTHEKKQREEDDCDQIFEIPLETARTFVNFRHDQWLEADRVERFLLLSQTKQGFLNRIFSS